MILILSRIAAAFCFVLFAIDTYSLLHMHGSLTNLLLDIVLGIAILIVGEKWRNSEN